jgi:hypothetical protein
LPTAHAVPPIPSVDQFVGDKIVESAILPSHIEACVAHVVLDLKGFSAFVGEPVAADVAASKVTTR